MNRSYPSFFWKKWLFLFFLGFLILAVSAFFLKKRESSSLFTDPIIAEVPDFSFLTSKNQILEKKDLMGHIWVFDSIFTRCSGPCPLLTSKMAELSQRLNKAKEIKLVSLTVDPDYDTPEILDRYATNLTADPQQWFFLTGKRENIISFITQGMKQPFILDPKDRTPNHSTQLVLIDQYGRIRKTYSVTDPEVIQKIMLDIGKLMRS